MLVQWIHLSLSVACGPLIINDEDRHLSNREVSCTVFVVCASIYVSVCLRGGGRVH